VSEIYRHISDILICAAPAFDAVIESIATLQNQLNTTVP